MVSKKRKPRASVRIVRTSPETQRNPEITLENWKQAKGISPQTLRENVSLDCGWGRLIFAHTFRDDHQLAQVLAKEDSGERDIAFYVRDPHVLLSLAPQDLFLDPSHTYRFWLDHDHISMESHAGFRIRRLKSEADAEAMNVIYASRGMVEARTNFIWQQRDSTSLTYFLAESTSDGEIIGSVMGVDHVEAFGDPEDGSSLWCLAVSPTSALPGVGRALTEKLLAHYAKRKRKFLDLSVMHNNKEAIALYESLGLSRVPVFCVKHKNIINEPLYVGDPPEASLNPYAEIIVKEARRRGIYVDVLNAEYGYFMLTSGGRSIRCRESLSDLTTGVAFSICDHKRLTHRVLTQSGIRMPDQVEVDGGDGDARFLKKHGRVVVKPARGEQGQGVVVDVREISDLRVAIKEARQICPEVILEQYVSGEDLRLVVINHEVVAAALRRPPRIIGTGKHTVRELIEKKSRRREASTQGESCIPLDVETERCIESEGYSWQSVLPKGERLRVRKTANLHTGGSLSDVTDRLHPHLRKIGEDAAQVIGIPVVGLDLSVPRVDGPDYYVIEANERVGLANHEPQPTAQKFIDLLFPETVAQL